MSSKATISHPPAPIYTFRYFIKLLLPIYQTIDLNLVYEKVNPNYQPSLKTSFFKNPQSLKPPQNPQSQQNPKNPKNQKNNPKNQKNN
jgi:hypothetical protein